MALFGEAEKGPFDIIYPVQNLVQLMETFGHPPSGTQGLFFAVQALLYDRDLLFIRVHSEGFDQEQYFSMLRLLREEKPLHALCLPGVGDPDIFHATTPICRRQKALLITHESALYDFLSSGFTS
jgi:hypothetical protein